MKRELTWADHFGRWELSGLSKKDYCARHGLSYQMFFYHQRRNQELRTSSGFQEVMVDDLGTQDDSRPPGEEAILQVQFSNGAVLFFPEHLLDRVIGLITPDRAC